METGNQAVANSGAGAIGIVAAAEGSPLSSTMESVASNIYEIDPLCDPRWAALVASHPRGSVFHSTSWLRALQNTYAYDPVVVSTCPPDVPLTNGLVFCHVKSRLTGRRFVSLPFSDHCEPLVNTTEELNDFLLHMRRRVNGRKWKYVEIRPLFHRPSSLTGFGRVLTYQFHRLDLRRSTQELFHNFHKDCVQRKIFRAEREKLRYEEGTSEDLLQKFYRLLVMTRRRQHLPPQPLAWFRGLIAAFGTDLKVRVASKDASPVASILTLSHKKSMVYKYGCSDAACNKFGGMALLLWKTILEAKDKGFEELDMGRSDTENLGLIVFKEHWGTAAAELNYWTYPCKTARRASDWEKNLVKQVVSAVPDSALKVVGQLFYRHIG